MNTTGDGGNGSEWPCCSRLFGRPHKDHDQSNASFNNLVIFSRSSPARRLVVIVRISAAISGAGRPPHFSPVLAGAAVGN